MKSVLWKNGGTSWQCLRLSLRRWQHQAALVLLSSFMATTAQAFDLQFNAVTDVDPAPTSGVLEYSVQIENSGNTAATDVRTVFAIPAGASVEGGALALPSAGNANCAVSGAYVVCSHGDMNGTGSGSGTPPISFTLRFRAPATLPSPPNVVLRGAIGRGAPPFGDIQAAPAAFLAAGSSFWAGDSNESNNTSAAPSPLQQTTLENNADLSVAVVPSASPVVSGGRLTYTVTVTNNGPLSNATTGVRVLNTLPAGATYVSGSASGAGWSFSGPSAGVLTASRNALSLAVGASVAFTFEVTVSIASGTLTNNAEVNTDRAVSGALLDNNPNNNTASVVTAITPSADLELTKSFTSGSSPYVAGSTLSMRLAPRNLGQSTASSVVVRDVLPAQHTLAVSFPLPPAVLSVGSYTCRSNNANQNDSDQADAGRAARTILRCTRASLPVGDVENIDFNVVTDAALNGAVTNTASISASTADPSSTNNSHSVNYSVLTGGADVQLVSFDKLPTVVAATGGTVSNLVRVRNNGPLAVEAQLQVFIALNASETLVSAGSGWSCVAEAGGVRCTFTGSYPLAAGAISGSTAFPDLTLVTQAQAAGTLNSMACVGGSGGSAEPTVTGYTPGTTSDFVTDNDCSPTRSITATSQLSDLTLSKLTSTPTGGDKILGVSESAVSYTLTVTNLGPLPTPGVVVRDFLPGYIDSNTVVSICGYSGAGSCVPPNTDNFPATIGGFSCVRSLERVTCSSNTNSLASGAGNALTLVIRMAGAVRDSLSAAPFSGCSSSGQHCNLANVSIDSAIAGASLDPNVNNNEGLDTVVVHAAANIQTQAKTFSPAQAQVGVDTAYTINYRNPAASRSDLPAVTSPGVGVPAGVVFVDTFNLGANDPGFVLRSATIVSGAACTVAATTGGVMAAAAAGGTSYHTVGGAAGTVRIECPTVTLPRNTDRQLRIVVRPNIGALGPLQNTAGFRMVDSSGATVTANGANYDFNTDTSTTDDIQNASVSFVVGQVDLRVENVDLLDPAPWSAADVGTSPGGSDIVYRVQVRNGGPSLATNVRLDYTITPPTGAVIRYIGDEGGSSVTQLSGATAPQRCSVLTGSNPVVAPATLTLRCTSPGFGFTPNIDGALVQGTGADDGAFLNIRLRYESTPAPLGSSVSTLAVVTAAETELDASNNAEAEVTTVRTTADLSLAKTGFTVAVPALPAALPAAVTTVGLGQPFNWVVELSNSGPGDSLSIDRSGSSPLNGTGTVITDTLPAGVTVTGPITWQKTGSSGYTGSVTNGTGTCSLAGLTATCNVGDVGSNGKVRVSFPVRWDTWPGGSGNLSDPQVNNASASSQTTDPVGGNNSVTHAVRVSRSLLSGLVFVDSNRDGSPGAGEPGIAGVSLGLYPAGSSCPASGSLPAGALQTVTTDSSGAYSFSAAVLGTAYVICQQQPAAYGDRPAQPGAGNSTPGAQQIDVAALGSSGTSGNNFPEVLASLSGQVFADYTVAGAALANNGLRDGGEPGIGSATSGAGVPITLSGTPSAGPGAGTAITPLLTHTAADGSFSFNNLFPGSYTLTQGGIPAALGSYTDGINRAGSVSGGGTPGSAGGVGDNAIRNIVLAAGAQGNGNTFAELPPDVRISGLVYVDANRDGSLGAGDSARVGGVNLTLVAGSSCAGSVLATTSTDSNGAYSFNRASLTAPSVLIPGATYSLCQTQPSAFDDGSVNPGNGGNNAGANHIVFTALPGLDSNNNNFGELIPAVAPAPDLVVTKSHAPATFTELNRGSYTLTVRNRGNAASNGSYTVTDTLPAGLSAVAVPAAAGWTCSVSGQTISCSSSEVIAAAASHSTAVTVVVQAGQNLCSAGYPCSLNNVVAVSGGGEASTNQPSPAERANPPLCTATASQNVCRLPTPIQQSGGVSGLVWLDNDHDRRFTPGTDVRQAGFVVELLQGGTPLRTATTDAQGQYQFLGLVPGHDYEVRFRDAVTGAYYGRPVSTDPAGGNDPRASGTAGVVPDGSLRGFTVPGGAAVRANQNLPLDPSGVVYDSRSRLPVAGALVELLAPNGQRVPAQCVLGGVNSITTSTNTTGTVPGGYAFWLVSPPPVACPGDGDYVIRVTPPVGYINAGVPSNGSLTATSNLIPALTGRVLVPASCQSYVPGAPCAVQNQATAPSGAQPTPYFFTVPLSPVNLANFVDIVNNHIPLDPVLGTRFVISKQASRSTVEVGDAVSYTITVKHLEGVALNDVRVNDSLPAGFRYVPGTFKIANQLRADPSGAPGPKLRFDIGGLPVNGTVSFSYVTRAGVGAQQGDGINTAQATAGSGAAALLSNIARARVRITGGVFGAEACVVGKIYVDCNHNQVQDREELGIPGVRLVMQDGTLITSDSEGKYSLCGLPPRTHVLKADPLTLPRGSRLVTSSSRNAGDAHSIFVDLKQGELHRADFIEGSCSNTVLEQVKARRTPGEVRAVETEKRGGAALKFEGKAPHYPQQGTDSAHQQPAVRPRENAATPRLPVQPGRHEQNVPVPELPAASSNTQRR